MYKAIRQKNGKYIIPDVEIFVPYEDDTIEPKKVHHDELFDFVENFEKQREETRAVYGPEKDYLPRVHISHHDDGVQNRLGAGFLDNLVVRNNILYADLVGVPEGIVQEISQGKYPYRSVEFVGSGPAKRIVSLALLESREPYHKLPIMDELVKMQSKEKRVSIVVHNVEPLIFQKERVLEEENPVDPEETAKMQDDVIKEEDESFDYSYYAKKYEVSEDEIKKMMKKYADEGMCRDLKKMQEGSETLEDSDLENKTELQKFQANIISQFAALKREIHTLRKEKEVDQYSERLRKICETDPTVNFQAEKQVLSELSEKNRSNYLSRLEKSVQFQSPCRPDVLGALTPGEVKRYESALAKKLSEAYTNTLRYSSGEDVKTFQALYPKKEDYVNFGLEEEKKKPGFCKKNLLQEI